LAKKKRSWILWLRSQKPQRQHSSSFSWQEKKSGLTTFSANPNSKPQHGQSNMKNIIITGASSGIGFELAKKFLTEGNQVLAIARTQEKLQQLSIYKKNGKFSYLAIDLEKTESISLVFDAISDWKQVDILFNNAGLLVKKPFVDLTLQDFQTSLNVNFLAPVFLIQSLLSKFNEDSHIINISTMGAVQGTVKFPELAAYTSSKAALINLTEILAEEFKQKKITFNTIALGAVQTEMLEKAFPGYKTQTTPQEMANYLYNFALQGKGIQNGKIIQASNSTP
jgi:3-oxoacyl-[acyl-carrier protein] reductase